MRARLVGVLLLFAAPGVALADPSTLDEARALDQQGVRAYQEGRYKDAITYFTQARKLGAPVTEIWNVAKCHLKLDEPELAYEALSDYLSHDELTSDEREEAQKQRDALDRRTSPLTVTSTPTGARVLLDGKVVGATPLTLTVQPGAHEVRVEQTGYDAYARGETARFGRAIVLNAELSRGERTTGEPQAAHARRFSLEADAGASFARYGDAASSAGPLVTALFGFTLLDAERAFASFGARFSVVRDAWGTSPGVSNVAQTATCKLPADYAFPTFSLAATGTFGVHLSRRLRAGVSLGFGFAATTASDVGGDVFLPGCGASPGVQPAFTGSLELSYTVSALVRVVLRPAALDVQSAFAGTRTAPLDAGSAWVRYGLTLGAAFDL